MIAPQLYSHCDVINNRLWRYQQNENCARETRGRCEKIVVLSSLIDSLCRVRNRIMYVLSWWTVSALTWTLFCYLFPPLHRNSGNKHQNNPLVSAETVRHLITYIILYIFHNEYHYCWRLNDALSQGTQGTYIATSNSPDTRWIYSTLPIEMKMIYLSSSWWM